MRQRRGEVTVVTPVWVREDRLRPITLRPTPGERRLRWLAAVSGVLGLAQALSVAVVAPDVSFPVTLTAPDGPIGTRPAADQLVALPLPAVAAAVLAGPAVACLVLASRWGLPGYLRALRRDGRHPLPAALGGPVLVGAVALRAGLSDLVAVLVVSAVSLLAARPGRAPLQQGPVAAGARTRVVERWALPALPWVAVAGHLVAAGGPPAPARGALVLLAIGVGTAITWAVGDGPPVRALGPWRRDNMGEAGLLMIQLAASSAAGWLLVTTTDAA